MKEKVDIEVKPFVAMKPNFEDFNGVIVIQDIQMTIL